MAMPRLAGGTLLTLSPSISTSPELASSSPAMMRSKVDLPQPDGPTKTTNSPSLTSRSMPFSTSTLPKDLRMFWILSEPNAVFPYKFHGLAGAHAFVRGEADGERAHGIRHVPGQVDILADRLQQEGLLAVAELLMPGLALHRQHPVRLGKLAVRAGRGAVQADARGLGVRVDVVRFGALVHDDRHAAVRRDHVLHEERRLRDHRPPAASYQPTEPSSNSTCRWP